MTPDPIAQTLSQLKPIEELAAVGSWPPAPGWWALFLLIILSLVWVIPGIWRYYRQFLYRRALLTQVDHIEQDYQSHQNPTQALNAIACLMKQIAMGQQGRQQTAQLTGQAWLTFLDSGLPHTCFARQVPEELLVQRYQLHPDNPDVMQVLKLCRHWIQQLKRLTPC